jgi:hypothetical protein
MKIFVAISVLWAVAAARAQNGPNWRFAVSGDSRNYGDVVMPAIAKSVRANGARFYWHLGDYRAIYDFDEDILGASKTKLNIITYQQNAWQDFIDRQIAPFGSTPVFLAVGNHEMISPKTHLELLEQFADWFGADVVRSQRLRDNPSDHVLRTYYHWQEQNVDFITLDNSTPDQFDEKQLRWFEKVLEADRNDPAVRSVIVGMHDALPDSVSAGHSMNESAQGANSGRRVYSDLVQFRSRTLKEVQVLASHSHFLMSDVYNTGCREPADVLPGWIVGTAGAPRYRLPVDHSRASVARTDVYGYLLGTVDSEGHVTFEFREISRGDIRQETVARYGKAVVDESFAGNKGNYSPAGVTCPAK